MSDLTISEIEEDIEGFHDRIYLAKLRLSELLSGRLPFKEHKKRERQRRDLQVEIEHVNILIGYANEGIAIRQVDNGSNP